MTSEVDFRLVQNALDNAGSTHHRDLPGRAARFPAIHGLDFGRVDDSTFLYRIDCETARPHRIAIDRKDMICVHIITDGSYRLKAGGEQEIVRPATIQISNLPHSVSDVRPGSKVRGLVLAVDRRRFMDRYAPSLGDIPDEYRPIFTSPLGTANVMSFPLSSQSVFDVDRILHCPYEEPLRSLSISSIATDMLCRIVSSVNEFGRTSAVTLSSARRTQKAIEAAARIYRTELRNPPTLVEMSTRVGLNRNALTAGFRDAFGQTPHDYHREVRMAEAKHLLATSDLSISEIGRRVGYGSYASFARAYQDFFGRPPSAR